MVESAANEAERNFRLSLNDILDDLVADQFINRAADIEKTQDAGRQSSSRKLHPLVIVASQKLASPTPPHRPLTLEQLTQWLATRARLPYCQIDPLDLDLAAVGGLVSHAYAARYHILPIAVDQSSATFATAEPFLTEWVADLRNLLRRDIKRVVANPLDINRYLTEFYGLSRSVAGAERSRSQEPESGVLNFEQLLELGRSGELGAEDKPVVQIVDWLLQYALEQRASDIHLEPRREKGFVRFRIDGVLHAVYEMPARVMAAVTSRIKILGRMDVAERRRPQDGRIKTRTPAGREIELRLSTMPTAFGEKCVLRIFDPDVVVKGFRELGFDSAEAGDWEEMIRQPHGIVLVTGPTGSGKTTTLYSTLKQLARPEVNVCTIEDPIEMVAPELNQMQIQPAIDLGFAQGIRTLLRQDPDIIMVGEIRDLETAQMAVQAALTGHLVFSTLHTNDAPSAIIRLLELGIPHYLLQGTLVGVVAQRLARTLCPHCKIQNPVDSALWATLTHGFKVKTPDSVGVGPGCQQCRDTGFLGRTALYEMLTISDKLRSLICVDTQISTLRSTAFQGGMRPLRLSAAAHVAAGITTVEEALRVAPPALD